MSTRPYYVEEISDGDAVVLKSFKWPVPIRVIGRHEGSLIIQPEPIQVDLSDVQIVLKKIRGL